MPAMAADETEDSPERSASVHCRFQPEEAHLTAGGEREGEMHLRCGGVGQTGGQFRLVAPKGLQVEPALIAVEPMEEAGADGSFQGPHGPGADRRCESVSCRKNSVPHRKRWSSPLAW
jgi:hypothetical protein